ncbi:MAG: threonine dehydratase [Kangiellaceae bacterium]|nr:threonine dehydratase [Kangiellaceae bacterium]
MFTLSELEATAKKIYQVMPATPQYLWPQLSESSGCDVWVKHENHTPTTAFKVRGGINLVDHLLSSNEKPTGLISATRGNHGQSLSFAASKRNLPVTIVVPECNSDDQNRAIKNWGANLVIHGNDFEAARQYSLLLQKESGFLPIPPFHRELVLGVCTYALEFFSAVRDLDCVYAPIGMGSGICGLIKARDLLNLKTEVVGVVAEGAPTFSLSFEAGKIINTDYANTIADGVATSAPMEEAFEIIKNGAARVIKVSDKQIAQAMFQYYSQTHNLAEGAGAVSLAGLNCEKHKMKGKKVGLILSGGNIDFDRFQRYVTNPGEL